MTKVTFHTNQFFNAHGKQPRGFGGWVFMQADCHGKPVSDDCNDWFFATADTFANAKRQCKKSNPTWSDVSVGS